MGDWYTQQEMWVIESELENGTPIEDIARILRRPQEGIRQKGIRMGLIKGGIGICSRCGEKLPVSAGNTRKYCDGCQVVRHREVALKSYHKRKKKHFSAKINEFNIMGR